MRRSRDGGVRRSRRAPGHFGAGHPGPGAALHLALSTPEEHRLGSWLCRPHLADDPAPGEGARSDEGDIRPPDAPGGLGVAPDEEWLGEPWVVFD